MADYREYPRAVIESCETALHGQGVPQWFIDRFDVADETRPSDWGSVRTLGYQWPIPIVNDGNAVYPLDISDSMPRSVWRDLELLAVARAWLACFGERSPWELALVYEFAHLDALRIQQTVASEQKSNAGRKSVEARHNATSERDMTIRFDALALLEAGTPPHKLVSELAKDEAYRNPDSGELLSPRQLRSILQRQGILRPKRKK